jgi:hypothetical protein
VRKPSSQADGLQKKRDTGPIAARRVVSAANPWAEGGTDSDQPVMRPVGPPSRAILVPLGVISSGDWPIRSQRAQLTCLRNMWNTIIRVYNAGVDQLTVPSVPASYRGQGKWRGRRNAKGEGVKGRRVECLRLAPMGETWLDVRHMPKTDHHKAAAHHDAAARAQRTAAESHEKGDHGKATQHSKLANDHSTKAHESVKGAHEKSKAAKRL